jgi:hypothetical protein
MNKVAWLFPNIKRYLWGEEWFNAGHVKRPLLSTANEGFKSPLDMPVITGTYSSVKGMGKHYRSAIQCSDIRGSAGVEWLTVRVREGNFCRREHTYWKSDFRIQWRLIIKLKINELWNQQEKKPLLILACCFNRCQIYSQKERKCSMKASKPQRFYSWIFYCI